jgi:hypothetical protein
MARAIATVGVKQTSGLPGVLKFLRHAEPTDAVLLEEGLQTAANADDAVSVHYALETACARFNDLDRDAAVRIGLSAIAHLNTKADYSWVEPLALWGVDNGFIAAFSDEDLRAILDAMIRVRKIDYSAEQILGLIAQRLPNDVIGLFGGRLAYDSAEAETSAHDLNSLYEAFPFQFQSLSAHLADHCTAAVDAALEWSRSDIAMSEFRGGKFIAIIFPSGSDALRDKLLQLAATRSELEQSFVLQILRNMEGHPFAFTIVREIVATVAVESPLLQQARSVLRASGVMHGEFSYRDNLKEIRRRIEPWLTDQRQPVANFATSFTASLDNGIALAQREAEEQLARRRIDFDEPLRDDKSADNDQDSEGLS